jgi:YD repeat-containing protein
LDRRTGTGFPSAGEDRAYLYDQGLNGTGRLAGYDDPSGQTRFSYDVRGNVLTETRTIQGHTYSLAYVYDGADRLTSLTYPSGLTVTYSYDGEGRVQHIAADGQPVLSAIAYLPFGPATTWTDGSGLDHTETYDSDYRPTGITVGTIQDLVYLYDAADNIIDWTDGLDAGNAQSFGYDALDRLTTADGPYGAIDLGYDPVGNRLSKAVGTALTSYTYAADSHRLQETTGADPGSYVYDAAGNLIQDNRFSYVYNQANRLVEVRQGGATIATYSYNAEGQRVVKTAGGQTRHFVYGPDGALTGVYDAATGTAVEEILYRSWRRPLLHPYRPPGHAPSRHRSDPDHRLALGQRSLRRGHTEPGPGRRRVPLRPGPALPRSILRCRDGTALQLLPRLRSRHRAVRAV